MRTLYVVSGRLRGVWARYLYEAQAQAVAARCNADAGLLDWGVFDVTTEEA